MADADSAQLLTGQEVANRLRISVNTLYRLTDKGEIPGAVRLGNLRRYNADAISDLVNGQLGSDK